MLRRLIGLYIVTLRYRSSFGLDALQNAKPWLALWQLFAPTPYAIVLSKRLATPNLYPSFVK